MDYEKLIQVRDEKNCFARELGICTEEIREGYARVSLRVEEKHMNFVGSVHGGCLFSLADTVAGAASSSYGYYSTTVDGNIHYLSPAMNVKMLIAQAQVIKYGKRISVFEVTITDENGRLLAQGTYTYYNLGKQIEL